MKKGTIQEDFIPRNKAELIVIGLPPITFTSVTGIEEELQTVDLPDKTRRSGGHSGPSEMTATHPIHHVVEESALELWLQQSKDPVSPGYSRPAALKFTSGTGNITRTYPLVGVFPRRRTVPDYEAANEGEMAESTWVFSIDDVRTPI